MAEVKLEEVERANATALLTAVVKLTLEEVVIVRPHDLATLAVRSRFDEIALA